MMYIDEDMLNQIIDEMKGNNYTEEFHKAYTVTYKVEEERFDGTMNVHFDNLSEAVMFCDENDMSSDIQLMNNETGEILFQKKEKYGNGYKELFVFETDDYLEVLGEMM